ncbi:hypothetical protein PoB_003115400 [Plakobranchus ocellatus]|uniref:Uncharacterized protein n=1 Tax=Plakobranchus ocellatus TaxID=259542 RepID=A0AAV4AEH4_9GAST|nr:hypothetical protein PoB_003115400 [Plakobranchus ocellatus]
MRLFHFKDVKCGGKVGRRNTWLMTQRRNEAEEEKKEKEEEEEEEEEVFNHNKEEGRKKGTKGKEKYVRGRRR